MTLAARIALAYALLGSLYILFSDRVVDALFSGPMLGVIQSGKGLGFIAVTALALYIVLNAALRRQSQRIRLQQAGLELSQQLLGAVTEQATGALVCQFITTEMGYPLAWLAGWYGDNSEIVPTAAQGAAAAFVDELLSKRDDSALGSGPTGSALRSGTTEVSNNLALDPSCAPWSELAQRFGLASTVALPVRTADETVAVLNVYSARPGAFTADAVVQLAALATSLAAALARIHALAREEAKLHETRTQNAQLQAQKEQLLQQFAQRLEAQEALQLQEETFRRILGLSSSISVVQNAKFVYVNEACCAKLGYTRDELVGKPITMAVPERDREELMARYNARMSGGNAPTTYQSVVLRKDGVERTVIRTVVPIDFYGSPASLANDHDITDFLETQEELESERQRLQLSLEAAQIGLWDYDASRDWFTYDATSQRLMGWGSDDAGGSLETIGQAMHPDDRAAALEQLQSVLGGQRERLDSEVRFILATGEYVWLHIRGRLVDRGPAGESHRLRGTFLDVTQRKQQDAVLVTSEQRYRQVFEHNPWPLVVIRQADGVYTDVNRSAEKLYGYSREQMVGRTARELNIWVKPEDRDKIIANVHQVKVIDDVRTEFRRPNGQIIQVRLGAAEIEIAGEPFVLGLAQDISELHASQQRLQQLLDASAVLGLTRSTGSGDPARGEALA